MSKEQIVTNIYKCEGCQSKFKKSCPETVAVCNPLIECPKCGNKLKKVE